MMLAPYKPSAPGAPLRRVARAIDAAESVEGHGANGRLVVKMRHRAWPRVFRDFILQREVGA